MGSQQPTPTTKGRCVQTITERRVSYWAVQGERWCNVDGIVREEFIPIWATSGWRVVTRVTEQERVVFGELEDEVK